MSGANVGSMNWSREQFKYIKSALGILARSPDYGRAVLDNLKTISATLMPSPSAQLTQTGAAGAEMVQSLTDGLAKQGMLGLYQHAVQEGAQNGLDPQDASASAMGQVIDVLTGPAGEVIKGGRDLGEALDRIKTFLAGKPPNTDESREAFARLLAPLSDSPLGRSVAAIGIFAACGDANESFMKGDFWGVAKNAGLAFQDTGELLLETTSLFQGAAKTGLAKLLPFVGVGANVISGALHLKDFMDKGNAWSLVAAGGDLLAAAGDAFGWVPGVGAGLAFLGTTISSVGDLLAGDTPEDPATAAAKQRSTEEQALLESLRGSKEFPHNVVDFLEECSPARVKTLVAMGLSPNDFQTLARDGMTRLFLNLVNQEKFAKFASQGLSLEGLQRLGNTCPSFVRALPGLTLLANSLGLSINETIAALPKELDGGKALYTGEESYKNALSYLPLLEGRSKAEALFMLKSYTSSGDPGPERFFTELLQNLGKA